MRRAHRLDANHSELVDAFRSMGCSVLSLAGLGNGCPDIVVGLGGIQVMVEIKDGSRPPSARKLTPDEARFRGSWTGGYKIVEDMDGVKETVELLQSWRNAIYQQPASCIRWRSRDVDLEGRN